MPTLAVLAERKRLQRAVTHAHRMLKMLGLHVYEVKGNPAELVAFDQCGRGKVIHVCLGNMKVPSRPMGVAFEIWYRKHGAVAFKITKI